MRQIFLFVLMVLSINTIAQTKAIPASKTTTKPTSASPAVKNVEEKTKSAEELIAEKADKWFKETYVVFNFKDPYSYKPMKTTVGDAVSYEQQLYEDTIKLKSGMGLLKNETDSTNILMTFLKNEQQEAIENSKRGSKSMREYYAQRVIKYQLDIDKERQKIQIAQKELDAKREKLKKHMEMIASLSESEKKKIGYYKIHHDAYGRNSNGAEVLGRYVYKWDVNKEKGYDVKD